MSRSTSFTASDELLTSLTIEAYTRNETNSAAIRRILKQYLVEAGLFGPKEPTTHQQYMNNPFFVSRREPNDE